MAKSLRKEKRKVLCHLMDETLELDNEDRFYREILGFDFMHGEDAIGCIMSIPKDFRVLNNFLYYIKEEIDFIGIEVLRTVSFNEEYMTRAKLRDFEDNLEFVEMRDYCDRLRIKESCKYINQLVYLDIGLKKDDIDHGGHFAMIKYNKDTDSIILWDSMQIKKDTSSYSEIFMKYVNFVFRKRRTQPYLCKRSIHKSRQMTGGFIGKEMYNFITDIKDLDKADMLFSYNDQVTLKEHIELQDFNQQHHFCWAESLRQLIESYLEDYGMIDDELEELMRGRYFPLFVIKRFIWKFLQIIDYKFYDDPHKNKIIIDYLKKHFTTVWTSPDIKYNHRKAEYYPNPRDLGKKKLARVKVQSMPKFYKVSIMDKKYKREDMNFVELLKYAYTMPEGDMFPEWRY